MKLAVLVMQTFRNVITDQSGTNRGQTFDKCFARLCGTEGRITAKSTRFSRFKRLDWDLDFRPIVGDCRESRDLHPFHPSTSWCRTDKIRPQQIRVEMQTNRSQRIPA